MSVKSERSRVTRLVPCVHEQRSAHVTASRTLRAIPRLTNRCKRWYRGMYVSPRPSEHVLRAPEDLTMRRAGRRGTIGGACQPDGSCAAMKGLATGQADRDVPIHRESSLELVAIFFERRVDLHDSPPVFAHVGDRAIIRGAVTRTPRGTEP